MTLPDIETEPLPGPIAEPRAMQQVEMTIGMILRYGVILSMSLVFVGMCITFYRHPEFRSESMPLRQVSQVSATFPHTITDTLIYMENWRGRGFVIGGLLILLLTPVVSVAVSIVAFAKLKDRTFALIASAVLAILLLSFYVGSLQKPVPVSRSGATPMVAPFK